MSETTVVNLYRDEYDVYIGRAGGAWIRGRGQAGDGQFGNPIRIGTKCLWCDERHMTAGDTLQCYEEYLRAMMECDDAFRELVHSLRGKRLGCYCKPKPCHGDVLKLYADGKDYINAS